MIKRMMLLAVSACALVAFVVPAMAQANPHWAFPGNITDGTGELTSVSATGLNTGPAKVKFSGVTTAATEGTILDFEIEVPVGGIPTNVPNCFATAATNSTTSGLEKDSEGNKIEEEWPVTLGTSGAATHMTVENVTFTNHYAGAGCAGAGVPAKVSVTGAATLIVVGGAGNAATANGVNDPLTVENPVTGQHVVPAIPVNLTSTGNLTWTGPAVTP